MKNTIIVMSLAVVGLAILAFMQGGVALVLTGLEKSVLTLWGALPMLVAAFALSGLVQVLLDPVKISAILGRSSGFKGILIGSIGGALLPGGPYVVYPLISSFIGCGAQAPIIMALIMGKNLWSATSIPLEMAILGTRVTMIRFVITFSFPILAAYMTRWFYPGLTDAIPTFQKQLQQRKEESKE